MKKFFLLFICLCLIFFPGCSSKVTEENCLDYQSPAFEAQIEATMDDFTFSATIYCQEWHENDNNFRDISIIFSEPDALKSIKAERIGGKITLNLGNITLEGDDEYKSLIAFAELFQISAIPTSISLEGENTRVRLTGHSGELYSILLDKNGLPLEIIGKDYKIVVNSFAYTD